MSAKKIIWGLLLLLTAMVGTAHAQHIRGTAFFSTTPNGPVTIEFQLDNADTADSGTGTIEKINGTTVNISINWYRDANGVVWIVLPGGWVLQLWNCSKNLPYGSGGQAILNDGNPGSPGAWARTNTP